jgi:hypothetical protein
MTKKIGLNIKSLFHAIKFVGITESVRSKYYVYQSPDAFILIVASKKQVNSGNFNIIEKDAVMWTWKKLAGKKSISVTDAKVVIGKSKKYNTPFDVHATLYVLVALKNARITKVVGSKLFFAVNKFTA